MKKIHVSRISAWLMALVFALFQLPLLAQDNPTGQNNNSSTTTTTTETTTWYVQPWVWIVGGVVLLIIILALVRGSGNKEVHRTTVVKDR